MSSQLDAILPGLTDSLRKLGLSSYETLAYVTLVGIQRPATVEELKEKAKKYASDLDYGTIPETRVYNVLNDLVRKGLVRKTRKRAGRGTLYEALIEKPELDSLVELRIRDYRKAALEAWGALQSLRTQEGMWRVGTEEEAIHVTKEMWKDANEDIMLMTETGRWILKSQELKSIIQERLRNPNFEAYVVVSRPSDLSKEKRSDLAKFESYLGEIGNKNTHVYHYRPTTFRMDIVDGEGSLLFMYGGSEKPYIYFSHDKDIAKSLSRLFVLECLLSDEAISVGLPQDLKERVLKFDKDLGLKMELIFDLRQVNSRS